MVRDNEKGAILVIVLFVLLILGIFIASIAPQMRGEATASVFNNRRISARYAAESGSKVGLFEVLTALSDGTVPTAITADPRKVGLADGAGSFTLSYRPDNVGNPTRIEITSQGETNEGRYSSLVYVWLTAAGGWQTNPGVVDLFDNNVRYSTRPESRRVEKTRLVEKRRRVKQGNKMVWETYYEEETYYDTETVRVPQTWGITTDPTGQRFANPTIPGEYCQVYFADRNMRNFRVSYSATAQVPIGAGTGGGATGYGIYYYGSSSPDDPTGYVVQWDPGAYFESSKTGQTVSGYSNERESEAMRGCFFVKKNFSDGSIGRDERWDDSNWDYRYSLQNNQGHPDDVRNNKSTAISGGNGISRVPFTYVRDVWNAHFKDKAEQEGRPWNEATDGFKVFNQDHKITIDTMEMAGNKIRHRVFIDGIPFLDFCDNTTQYQITNFEGTCTGLRVWNCQVEFQNDPSDSINQFTGDRIQWVR